MIVSVCVMFSRHLTPRSKGYFVGISMVGFVLKGGGGKYSPRYFTLETLTCNVMRNRLTRKSNYRQKHNLIFYRSMMREI
jgi:hypothetical protein